MNTTEKFDLWCVVELFGHTKIAGKCTEQNIAGTNMLRVDVPATETDPPFTRFLGSSAIYSINPVDEVTAKHFAKSLSVKPVNIWDIKEIVRSNSAKLLLDDKKEEVCNEDYGNDKDDDDYDY